MNEYIKKILMENGFDVNDSAKTIRKEIWRS